MNLTDCYICKNKVEAGFPANSTRHYVIDEVDNLSRICDTCHKLLKGKVVLIVADNMVRTGEVMFITRRVFNELNTGFPDDADLYIITTAIMREIAERIVKLQWER